jgi:hypothetical protein
VTAPSLDALVASPHWEWLVGMAGIGFEPGRSVHVRVFADFAAVDEQEDTNIYSSRGLHPDLDDPATCGHMLGLVRKAWGADCRVEVTIEDDGSADVSIYRRADGRVSCVHVSRRDTLGQALAAALLAAPAKAGEP